MYNVTGKGMFDDTLFAFLARDLLHVTTRKTIMLT